MQMSTVHRSCCADTVITESRDVWLAVWYNSGLGRERGLNLGTETSVFSVCVPGQMMWAYSNQLSLNPFKEKIIATSITREKKPSQLIVLEDLLVRMWQSGTKMEGFLCIITLLSILITHFSEEGGTRTILIDPWRRNMVRLDIDRIHFPRIQAKETRTFSSVFFFFSLIYPRTNNGLFQGGHSIHVYWLNELIHKFVQT